MINCMCHSTENLYRMTDSAVVRSSDDFWPRDPASHTTHVAVNAYNSVFLSPILQPDWDMFQSQHPAAQLHATARVISGGPIYVSDRPGKHNFKLLQRVVLPDGSILRCLKPGLPTRDCLFLDVMRDGQSLLKVWNVNRVGGVIAVFNTQGACWSRATRMYTIVSKRVPTLETVVRVSDIPLLQGMRGTSASGTFVVWSDHQQSATVLSPSSPLPVTLGQGESDLLTFMPLVEEGTLRFAPIGLINMLNAGGAVLSSSIGDSTSTAEGKSRGTLLNVKVRGSGHFAAFSSVVPSSVKVNGSMAEFHYASADQMCTLDIPRLDDEDVTSLVFAYYNQ
eukprot:jgi/Botrbrau1/6608/Bobra.0189s0035.1